MRSAMAVTSRTNFCAFFLALGAALLGVARLHSPQLANRMRNPMSDGRAVPRFMSRVEGATDWSCIDDTMGATLLREFRFKHRPHRLRAAQQTVRPTSAEAVSQSAIRLVQLANCRSVTIKRASRTSATRRAE